MEEINCPKLPQISKNSDFVNMSFINFHLFEDFCQLNDQFGSWQTTRWSFVYQVSELEQTSGKALLPFGL